MADNTNINRTIEEISYIRDAINAVGAAITEEINDRLDDSDSILNRIQRNVKNETTAAFKDLSKGLNSTLKNQIALNEGTLKQSDIAKQLNTIEAKRANLSIAINQAISNGIIELGEAESIEQSITEQLQFQQDLLKDQSLEVEKQNKKLKTTGPLLSGLSKIPVLGNFIDANKALTAAQVEAAREGSTTASVFKKGFGSAGTSLKTNLLNPVTLTLAAVQQLAKGVLRTNEIQVKLAKNLTLSRNEAGALQNRLSQVAATSGDLLATTTSLSKALGDVQSAFGFIGKIASNDLVQFNRIKEAIGLSASSASGLLKQSTLQGKTLEENKNLALEQSQAVSAQLGVQINNREVLEEIGNISNYTLVQFRGSTEAVARTVAQAKALGLELKDIASTQNALLNFEQSIGDELSAELLTGKQLNLERARFFALTNDIESLQGELLSQVGSLSEFQGMNVLAQRAFAQSLGLSVDKVADLLTLEQFRGKTQQEIAALAGDEVAKRLETLTLQQEFGKTVEKLQQTLVDIVTGPIGQVLGAALDVTNAVLSPIGKIVGGISSAFEGGGERQAAASRISENRVNVSPGTTNVKINLNNSSIGNATARTSYNVGQDAFGGVDYSAIS